MGFSHIEAAMRNKGILNLAEDEAKGLICENVLSRQSKSSQSTLKEQGRGQRKLHGGYGSKRLGTLMA